MKQVGPIVVKLDRYQKAAKSAESVTFKGAEATRKVSAGLYKKNKYSTR